MRGFSVFKGRRNYIQATEATLHLIFIPGYATVKLMKSRLGYGYDSIIGINRNDFVQWLYDQEDLKRITERLINEIEKDPHHLEKIIALWGKDLEKYVATCKFLDDEDLWKLTDEELILAYDEFLNAYLAEWSIPIIADAISLHSEGLARHGLIRLLKNQGEERNFPKYFPLLTSPVNISFANSEKKDMLRMALGFSKSGYGNKIQKMGIKQAAAFLISTPGIYKRLLKHSKKYHWIRNSYLISRDLKPTDFALELAEFLKKGDLGLSNEIRRMDANFSRLKREKAQLARSLKISGELKLIFGIIERFGWWQDERKKQNLIGDHYVCRFLNEFARRLHATYFDLAYTTPFELVDCLKRKKIDVKIMKDRRKYSIMVIGKGCDGIFVGKEATGLEKILLGKEKPAFDDVRGQCASIGRAEGFVRIINNSKDIAKMKPGDILVSSMTRPELVPAMKKAAAVVTDEGGITSHAAIVSRELGIPCIIGTKVATKMLKDGDFVEVNANHGVVRKVE